MASWDPTELMLIFAIALIILGPKRLPEIANKIGGWVGKARRMTRVLRRQLEDELDMEQGLNVRPKIQAYVPPNDDDTYSPMHPAEGAIKVEAEAEAADDQAEPSGDEPDVPPQQATSQETPAADDAVTDDDGDRRAS
ncbi:MAG: twin-arginine translocase TatA/TatE family subunit [Woeseiaceae bacterium]|nr:twin-arginine translocase TatA/TatE family subunit [Woeseiaceae bacterium]